MDQALTRHPDIARRYDFLMREPADLLTVSTERGPWVLDALWGNFFATGDAGPLLRIIAALPWIDESRKAEVMAKGRQGLLLMTIAGAARWSLTSNAQRHPRVLVGIMLLSRLPGL